MGLSLEELLFLNKADQVHETDFLINRNIEVWISEIKSFGTFFYVMEDAPIGSTKLKVISTGYVTLYRHEVLKFWLKEEKAVVSGESKINLLGTSIINVYPLEAPIKVGFQTMVWGMMPLLSSKEGGFPQSNSIFIESHNKNQGLIAVFQQLKRERTGEINGEINRFDPSFRLLSDIKQASINKIKVQLRHQLFVGLENSRYGEGIFAIEYEAIPSVSFSDLEADFLSFTLKMVVVNEIADYKIPTGEFPVRYCPQDNADFYYFFLEGFTANYCPQDNTGYYEITGDLGGSPINYCPQNTTNFYDIFIDDFTYCPQNINGFYLIEGMVVTPEPNYCSQNTTNFYNIDNFAVSDINYCPQNTTNFYDFTQSP